jgi:hypothetical protein
MLLFLASDAKTVDLERARALERTVFGDERVLIVGQLFRFGRIDADATEVASELRGRGAGVVLVSGTGEVRAKLFGSSCTPSTVYAGMRKLVAESYKGSLDRFVKDYRDILHELDRIADLKLAFEEKAARTSLASSSNEREMAAAKEEIEKREARVAANETKALEAMKLKTA